MGDKASWNAYLNKAVASLNKAVGMIPVKSTSTTSKKEKIKNLLLLKKVKAKPKSKTTRKKK